jgi:UDP-N-acetylglucosamine diphosphorylase/glucosamine-1-phosphate N-acetyltransferase
LSAHLVLFEDRHWRELRPLADTLPVAALAFGASCLGERLRHATRLPLVSIEARAGALAAWAGAPALAAKPAARSGEILALNSAALPGPWLAAALETTGPALLMGEGRVAGARLPLEMAAAGLGRGAEFESWLLGLGLPSLPAEARFVRWPWELMEWNAGAIVEDLGAAPGSIDGEVHAAAVLLEPARIRIARGATVEPLAVLDARGGPIAIGAGALVRPHTVVSGPCVVGERTQLLGGFIGRSTFGPECRIAGEVEECVWQGFSNKRHHGFVGHSVIGEWVNLGALTTTSDLKNNYGPVRVWVDGREIDTGSSKVGSTIGAHAKTGIGTLLPTGASVGVGTHLFGGGRFAPRQSPAFGWWDGERMVEHRLDRFLGTAGVAMGRRGRTLGPADRRLYEALFAATARERVGG